MIQHINVNCCWKNFQYKKLIIDARKVSMYGQLFALEIPATTICIGIKTVMILFPNNKIHVQNSSYKKLTVHAHFSSMYYQLFVLEILPTTICIDMLIIDLTVKLI
ncbi:hypothetical protein [Drosophila suzukii associated hytrosavirus 1]|nr:hypothetical protein [Drosophila suzukii associated hytrosavirus 1]